MGQSTIWQKEKGKKKERRKRRKEGLSGRREDIISNLYPLQHQPNYKVLIVQAAEEIACKIPHKMSVLVMLIMTVVSQSPTSLNMRVMGTKQQAPLSREEEERWKRLEMACISREHRSRFQYFTFSGVLWMKVLSWNLTAQSEISRCKNLRSFFLNTFVSSGTRHSVIQIKKKSTF